MHWEEYDIQDFFADWFRHFQINPLLNIRIILLILLLILRLIILLLDLVIFIIFLCEYEFFYNKLPSIYYYFPTHLEVVNYSCYSPENSFQSKDLCLQVHYQPSLIAICRVLNLNDQFNLAWGSIDRYQVCVLFA